MMNKVSQTSGTEKHITAAAEAAKCTSDLVQKDYQVWKHHWVTGKQKKTQPNNQQCKKNRDQISFFSVKFSSHFFFPPHSSRMQFRKAMKPLQSSCHEVLFHNDSAAQELIVPTSSFSSKANLTSWTPDGTANLTLGWGSEIWGNLFDTTGWSHTFNVRQAACKTRWQ